MEAFQARPFVHDLSAMRFFTGLTELCIMAQPNFTSLNGLQYCPNLMTLWINECGIKTMGAALKGCKKLKAVHMCNNKIRTIENLDDMPVLEVLWLCNNKITSVDGLSGCPKLRVLWLASNRIKYISTGLDGSTQLAEVNLADNLVGEFKQVLNLGRCETLRTLSFSDPHYGGNPLCNLCNYQTYVLYHLGQLTTLDSMYISRESKQLAEATYMKKKMYYNMRIKTLKRNTNNVIRLVLEKGWCGGCVLFVCFVCLFVCFFFFVVFFSSSLHF
jgi:Leucine-rich repeat (LRR) protein